MANVDRAWDERYQSGDTPWDSGLPSRELQRVVAEYSIVPGRAVELGCGTGTNSIWLAGQGFDVLAVDCSPPALERARQKAATAGVVVDFREGDVQRFGGDLPPFDFIFDRGCYHCCRRVDLEGYQETLRNVSRPGTWALILAGNANEQSTEGPPRVTEEEMRSELGRDFDVVHLRPFHFEDAGGRQGPLGWSLLLRRPGRVSHP